MSAIPHHTSDPICPMCQKKLEQAEPVLAEWFNTHVKPHYPDAHISCAYRDKAEQEQAVRDHKSALHFPKSAHNKIPCQALDLFQLDEAGHGLWNPRFFFELNRLNLENQWSIAWGGHFKQLGDYDHFQIASEPSSAQES